MNPRYEIMDAECAKAAGIADPPYDTWEDAIEEDERGWDRPSYYVVDTIAKAVIGSDGGEPEDQTLSRDWSWVVGALNDAYFEGLMEGHG